MLRRIDPRGIWSSRNVTFLTAGRGPRRCTRQPSFNEQIRPLSSRSSTRRSRTPITQTTSNDSPWIPSGGAGLDVVSGLDPHLQPYPTSPSQILPPSSSSHAPNVIHHVSPMLASYPAPSPNHNNLTTFLAYARRTGLNPVSTTYRGTLYEYLVQSVLRAYGMDLIRVGGRGDGGVDMVGTWSLPAVRPAVQQRGGSLDDDGKDAADDSSSEPAPPPPPSSANAPPVRVAIQCKRFAATSKSSLGPSLVRELEGAVRRRHAGLTAAGGLMGILVSTRPATKGLREAMRDCRLPMGWICLGIAEDAIRDVVEQEADIKATVHQILWNEAAASLGLLVGIDATPQYDGDGDHRSSRVVLTRNGQMVAG